MPAPRILVTRSPHQASELADHLRALGAEPILIPAIELTDPTTYGPLDEALQQLNTFHWLLFTSANAVHAFHQRNPQLATRNSQRTQTPRIAAIGQATARALSAIGLTADLIPPQAVAESLTTSLLPHALQPEGTPTRFLLIRAEDARDHLPDTLLAAGAEVTIAPAYRTITPAASISAIRELFASPATVPDAITFTSSATARNFFALLEAAGLPSNPTPQTSILNNHPSNPSTPQASILNRHPSNLTPQTSILNRHPRTTHKSDPSDPKPGFVLASIGPITSATLRELGYPPGIEAREASVSALAQDLVKYLDRWKTS